ncbi:MAG: RNA-binding S4 domain-containing protein [Defluviitaleaceae bacterium]|nr:RNA-binding S4 domain-containing protein [Defluviitaleaceae bacterium]
MRLDKFLKISRIIKRRTVANDACDAGRVSLNGRVAKAGAEVSVGDIVEIRFGSAVTKAEITSIKEQVSKDAAGSLYRIV